MRNDFAIFILSHGRAKTMRTLKTIQSCGYTGRWYIVCDNEDDTIEEYYDLYGKPNVIVFNKLLESENCDTMDIRTRKRSVILFARNVCFEIAKSLDLTYFLELDDDYIEFRERYEKNGTLSSRFVLDFDRICEQMLEFLDTSGALTVAFSQMGDFIGGLDCAMFKQRLTRKCMNSFFCRVDRPFKFIGRINEDVNTYCLLGTQGKLLFTVADIALNQVDTQQGGAGMTTTYIDGGTYVKSFYSVIACPSCVKVAEMGVNHKRFHHSINWENCLPKILSDRYRKGD